MKSDESETTVRGAYETTARMDNPFLSRLTVDNEDATNGDVVIAKEIARLRTY
jgi:hypothetical protein